MPLLRFCEYFFLLSLEICWKQSNHANHLSFKQVIYYLYTRVLPYVKHLACGVFGTPTGFLWTPFPPSQGFLTVDVVALGPTGAAKKGHRWQVARGSPRQGLPGQLTWRPTPLDLCESYLCPCLGFLFLAVFEGCRSKWTLATEALVKPNVLWLTALNANEWGETCPVGHCGDCSQRHTAGNSTAIKTPRRDQG